MTTPAPPRADPRARRQALERAAGRLLRRLESSLPTEERKGDRGALAALRRAAGKKPAEFLEAAAIVFRDLPEEVVGQDSDGSFEEASQALFTMASLFAVHPRHGKHGRAAEEEGRPGRRTQGLGASVRAIRRRESGEDDDGVERRFVALLECEREALATHLRHLITLLKARSESTPIDYLQLFRDILDWDAPERWVQRDWAAGFWSRDRDETDKPAPEANGTNDDNDADN